MGKYIGQIYKYCQFQLSTLSLKAPVSSYSDPQTLSSIESTTTYVPSVRDKHQNNYFLYSQNTIHNDASIKNNDSIQSCEKARKNYIIPATSTPNHHTQLVANTSASILSFQNDGKTSHATRCIKSRIMNNVIDYVLAKLLEKH